VKKIVSKLPRKKQTLFFSATMPAEISSLAHSLLHDPEHVAVSPVSSTVDTIDQSVYFVAKAQKRNLLDHLLKDELIVNALIFTRTKHGADKLCRDLHRSGVRAEAIHGNKSQNARQSALHNFKTRRTRVLVATDIAARGIDVENLSHVINYEIPNIAETYVHRIGRTGRAGANGTAISFCDWEEKIYLRDIQKLTGKSIPVVSEHPFEMKDLNGNSVTTAATPAVNAFRGKSFGAKKTFSRHSRFRKNRKML
jgi:ATP-dependent RNA helicase RhlE